MGNKQRTSSALCVAVQQACDPTGYCAGPVVVLWQQMQSSFREIDECNSKDTSLTPGWSSLHAARGTLLQFNGEVDNSSAMSAISSGSNAAAFSCMYVLQADTHGRESEVKCFRGGQDYHTRMQLCSCASVELQRRATGRCVE